MPHDEHEVLAAASYEDELALSQIVIGVSAAMVLND